MKKIIIITLIVTILTGCINKQPLSKSQLVLDTQVKITLYDNALSNILDECFEICKKYELIFSRTNPKSELYQVNHADKSKPIELSNDLAKVIEIGLYYSKLSDGNFDISIGKVIDLWDFKTNNPKLPESNELNKAITSVDYQNIELKEKILTFKNPDTIIDLGAIAKGYIADQIKDYLVSQNVTKALINLGGNILCLGNKGDSDFKIGVANPQSNENILTLNINDKSVVTSGIYERYFIYDDKYYHHILNPKTGYSYDNGLASVTIISDLSVDGDALSTVCFTLGKDKGIEFVDQIKGVEAIFIDKNNEIFYSKQAKKYLVKN